MCGIFGIVASKDAVITVREARKIADTLFLLSESRGKESSGLAVFSNNAISVCKAQQPASVFIRQTIYEQLIASAVAPFTVIGHARLVTNGVAEHNRNNQPVIKDSIVGIHNGIITNDAALWKKFSSLKQRYEVDTEVLLSMVRYYLDKRFSTPQALARVFQMIEGSASVAFLFAEQNILALATNTGSLYITKNKKQKTLLFASERYILEQLGTPSTIQHIQPQTGCIVDINTAHAESFHFSHPPKKITSSTKRSIITDISPKESHHDKAKKLIYFNKQSLSQFEKQYAKNETIIRKIHRCTRCILPETMPFIEFDGNGVCNFCRNYQKHSLLGETKLRRDVKSFRRKDGKPDCIVAFSGGRDSSFALHYVKKVLGMHPVAYSYDWGMLTDLGRRNQARMCGALGVEHILVSADIRKKREYIRMNVLAWLKKPDLGMIPLFMAGDKQYFYYANKLRKQMGIDVVIYAENSLEQTDFKYGFCGVAPKFDRGHLYNIGVAKKLQLASYYASQYAANPSYLNSSLVDSVLAFGSSYVIAHKYIHLFGYIPWEEKRVNLLLQKEYNWELAPDSRSTWRIGDGTAAFYNYIYYTVAGFTENDTFRSNQVREGMITRNEAMRLIASDNAPRYESIQWYCETIGVDLIKTLKVIHSISHKWVIKKRILVLTSTFPRWKDDTTPPFVFELESRLTKYFNIHVLAPHYPGAKKVEMMEGLHVHRFQYFWPAKFQKLCYGGGILPRLKKNKLLVLQIFFFLLFELIGALRIIKQENIQLIHAHWLFPQGLIALCIYKICNIPYVLTLHGGDMHVFKRNVFFPFIRSVLQNAQSITVVNTDMKRTLKQRIHPIPEVSVISMGVDTDIFHPKRHDASIKRTYGIRGPLLLFVGSLVEKKGVKYILQAMPDILSKYPLAKLLIIGDGEQKEELQSIVRELGIQENVLFIGAIPNNKLPQYYASADVFISPSIITDEGDQEGLPVTYLEAMASGLFVITTDLLGNMDLITQGVNGSFVKQRDSNDIATHVLRYLKQKDAINKKNISNSLPRRYTWDSIGRKYYKLMKQI